MLFTWQTQASPITRGQIAPSPRLHALDAIRGILATVVVAHHASQSLGTSALALGGSSAVIVFFMISGYVLALAYDGRWVAFLVKRLVRLWPVYAVCMIAGFALVGRWPPALLSLWSPGSYAPAVVVDLPVWTLFVEVWMTPLLPIMFWLASRGRPVALALALGYCLLVKLDVRLLPIGVFGFGIAAAQFDLRFPQRVPAALLWLGRISYSLYLSHWIVFSAATRLLGPLGTIPAIPFVFIVGWALWLSVERPSVQLSREVAHRVDRALVRLFNAPA